MAKAESDGTVILSVIVGPCRFHETKGLSRFQAVNDPSRPLKALSTVEREKVYLKVSQRIERLQQDTQEQQDITWEAETISESRDGEQAYEVELQYFKFSSSKYQNIGDINDYIKGRLVEILFRHRMPVLDPKVAYFIREHGQIGSKDIYTAQCSEPSVVGKVISIQYTNWSYAVSAAHPNHGFLSTSSIRQGRSAGVS